MNQVYIKRTVRKIGVAKLSVSILFFYTQFSEGNFSVISYLRLLHTQILSLSGIIIINNAQESFVHRINDIYLSTPQPSIPSGSASLFILLSFQLKYILLVGVNRNEEHNHLSWNMNRMAKTSQMISKFRMYTISILCMGIIPQTTRNE